MKVNLISEVLDKQLTDSKGRQAGRIDGIVLELRNGKPPRVAYAEVGPTTLLSRFNRRLAHWYSRHDRKLGEGRGAAFRVPWSRLSSEGPGFVMDIDAEATPIFALEDWLRRHIVEHIPGGG
jgi:sporulation protein YlmC with PRC-barrel domain